MRFFSKKKKNDIGFIINTDDDTIKISGDKHLAPHAMTADEISGLWVTGNEGTTAPKTGALEALKKRMGASADSDTETKDVPKPKSEKIVLESDKKDDGEQRPAESTSTTETQDEPRKKTSHSEDPADNTTLIEKVKRYTIDDQGHDVSQQQGPIYQLQSVADILKSSGENAIKSLSEKYGLSITVDNLGRTKPDDNDGAKEPSSSEGSSPDYEGSEKTVTPIFEKMVTEAEERESREIRESLSQGKKTSEPIDFSVPDISDIDTQEVGISTDKPISNTATIRFTPVKGASGDTDHVTISSITKHIDLGDTPSEDISSRSIPDFEDSEFDSFETKTEFHNMEQAKKILLSLAKKRRSSFLNTVVSFFVLFLLSLFLIPPVYDFILADQKSTMIICSALLFVSVISNFKMFFDFKNLLSKRCSADIIAALCAVLTLSLGVCATVTASNAYYIILLCSIILFTRALFTFRYATAKFNSLKQITTKGQKNAVTLISDPATTFAMAKNSIDGDVLVAAHKKTEFVEDFMKHFDFNKTMSGKISTIFFTTTILSVISGMVAYFSYQSAFYAFYSAAIIACIAAMPTVFFIDALPLSSAAKKLNAKGAMIAGVYGAEKIESVNSAVININDIFPEGTITMHNMKVLSDNSIDEILLRAASLTAAVKSPLHSIFKKIAGTNSSYSIPDSDTVKYEKNLGISGWVNNEPLFIGNRSLMKAHGIEIPDMEIDKRILQKGYFPVYVATSNTACALLVIQYNVDPVVAKELHKLINLGVLLLVDNCDPNVTDEMLCDYFDLYNDSVRIMNNAGVHMYKNLVTDVESCSSPAVFRGRGLNFIKLINAASAIKNSNRILTVMYILFAVLGVLYFVYAAFSGLLSMPQQTTILLYTLITTVLSIIGFLIRKP